MIISPNQRFAKRMKFTQSAAIRAIFIVFFLFSYSVQESVSTSSSNSLPANESSGWATPFQSALNISTSPCYWRSMQKMIVVGGSDNITLFAYNFTTGFQFSGTQVNLQNVSNSRTFSYEIPVNFTYNSYALGHDSNNWVMASGNGTQQIYIDRFSLMDGNRTFEKTLLTEINTTDNSTEYGLVEVVPTAHHYCVFYATLTKDARGLYVKCVEKKSTSLTTQHAIMPNMTDGDDLECKVIYDTSSLYCLTVHKNMTGKKSASNYTISESIVDISRSENTTAVFKTVYRSPVGQFDWPEFYPFTTKNAYGWYQAIYGNSEYGFQLANTSNYTKLDFLNSSETTYGSAFSIQNNIFGFFFFEEDKINNWYHHLSYKLFQNNGTDTSPQIGLLNYSNYESFTQDDGSIYIIATNDTDLGIGKLFGNDSDYKLNSSIVDNKNSTTGEATNTTSNSTTGGDTNTTTNMTTNSTKSVSPLEWIKSPRAVLVSSTFPAYWRNQRSLDIVGNSENGQINIIAYLADNSSISVNGVTFNVKPHTGNTDYIDDFSYKVNANLSSSDNLLYIDELNWVVVTAPDNTKIYLQRFSAHNGSVTSEKGLLAQVENVSEINSTYTLLSVIPTAKDYCILFGLDSNSSRNVYVRCIEMNSTASTEQKLVLSNISKSDSIKCQSLFETTKLYCVHARLNTSTNISKLLVSEAVLNTTGKPDDLVSFKLSYESESGENTTVEVDPFVTKSVHGWFMTSNDSKRCGYQIADNKTRFLTVVESNDSTVYHYLSSFTYNESYSVFFVNREPERGNSALGYVLVDSNGSIVLNYTSLWSSAFPAIPFVNYDGSMYVIVKLARQIDMGRLSDPNTSYKPAPVGGLTMNSTNSTPGGDTNTTTNSTSSAPALDWVKSPSTLFSYGSDPFYWLSQRSRYHWRRSQWQHFLCCL